jgi:hypothetical protein
MADRASLRQSGKYSQKLLSSVASSMCKDKFSIMYPETRKLKLEKI